MCGTSFSGVVMALEACAIVVRGRVQGVCFRVSTLREARRLGLTGWVRNELTGDVWIEAEGPRDGLEALVAWCRLGPEYAVVDDLYVDWHVAGRAYEDFSIR